MVHAVLFSKLIKKNVVTSILIMIFFVIKAISFVVPYICYNKRTGYIS